MFGFWRGDVSVIDDPQQMQIRGFMSDQRLSSQLRGPNRGLQRRTTKQTHSYLTYRW
jgi:hypothetical protein